MIFWDFSYGSYKISLFNVLWRSQFQTSLLQKETISFYTSWFFIFITSTILNRWSLLLRLHSAQVPAFFFVFSSRRRLFTSISLFLFQISCHISFVLPDECENLWHIVSSVSPHTLLTNTFWGHLFYSKLLNTFRLEKTKISSHVNPYRINFTNITCFSCRIILI